VWLPVSLSSLSVSNWKSSSESVSFSLKLVLEDKL
jgi:hypothetical protein